MAQLSSLALPLGSGAREHLPVNAVQAVNAAELFLDASVQPRGGEPDISLHITINAHASDGKKAQQLVKLFDPATRFVSVCPPI